MVQLKLYASGVSSGDAVASLIVPVSGKIVAVSWSMSGNTNGTNGMSQTYQLSQVSIGQFATNDARNIIDEAVLGSDCVSTTVWCVPVNKYTSLPGIKVSAGDKLYMHRLVSQAGTLALVNCVVTVV